MEWWMTLITTAGTSIGAAVGWLFAMRKHKAEAKGTEYTNFQTFVEANREIINDLRSQIVQLVRENSELRAELNTLKTEMQTIKKQYPCESCPSLR
jgi:predicted RNase H-like nuclease (RuvC/YqgF family)